MRKFYILLPCKNLKKFLKSHFQLELFSTSIPNVPQQTFPECPYFQSKNLQINLPAGATNIWSQTNKLLFAKKEAILKVFTSPFLGVIIKFSCVPKHIPFNIGTRGHFKPPPPLSPQANPNIYTYIFKYFSIIPLCSAFLVEPGVAQEFSAPRIFHWKFVNFVRVADFGHACQNLL